MLRVLFCLVLVMIGGCIRIPEDEAVCKITRGYDITPSIEEGVVKGLVVESSDEHCLSWEIFRDDQLQHLICLAIKDHPSMQLVEARVKRAEEEAKVVRSSLFPTIGLYAAIDWQYLSVNDFDRAFAPVFPGNVTEYMPGFQLQYDFDFWGKHRNEWERELGIMRAQAAEALQAKISLSALVSSAYFRWQSLALKLRLLQEEEILAKELLFLEKQRTKHALDTKLPLLFRETDLLEVARNIVFTKERMTLTEHTLNILIAESPDHALHLKRVPLKVNEVVAIPPNLSCNLLAYRPDLMAQIWRVEAAAHLVGAAKADFYPSINLTALAGLDSVFFSKLFQWESRQAGLFPALNLPIFTAGRIRANLRSKEAAFHEAIYAYNELLLNAVKDVTDQITELKRLEQEEELQSQILSRVSQQENLISLRFTHALEPRQSLLRERRHVLQEKIRLIQLQYERYEAMVALIKATGGGSHAKNLPLGFNLGYDREDGREEQTP